MILTKHFERLEPDTFNGYQIKVTFRYSSFDKKEIDAFEKILKDELGELVIAKCEVMGEVGENE